ncbi:NAD-dependent epimerase/dehydratase family protein [Pseudonocardia endophytica]|uniref:Nucleoside-diphosphate-sugar epimerase n=1 Tax=Pseudonocardia endophytica TaxID=401976 RepID=A0A4R1I0W7_PSEEN|nr:NAD-dependent epimerase/dehydratase family protein [Pseudonocardia endophytica]TCK26860.1 nucleoside-diphosphate-sugar epimerase [Pseudonocardia endophytica]
MTTLVTGGSGFVAGHCILALLEQGHEVRATVRSLSRVDTVRSVLTDAGMTRGDALTFVEADLTDDAGWADAVAGCDHVLHVASPVATENVTDSDAVIAAAREGTLRVLRAARDAGVTRVVLTSAFHAVGWGHPHDGRTFTDDDWTVLDGPGTDAYARSKTLAERSAWDLLDGGPTELTTLLPVAVMGPVMGNAVSGSNLLLQRILNGGMPGYPDLWIPIVDVRDVADAHVRAMTADGAAGQRFLLASDPAMSLKQVGATLRDHMGDGAGKVPTRSIPSVVVRLAALFSAEFRPVVGDLGYAKKVSDSKARRVLGWAPRPSVDAIVAAGESMVRRGLAGS